MDLIALSQLSIMCSIPVEGENGKEKSGKNLEWIDSHLLTAFFII